MIAVNSASAQSSAVDTFRESYRPEEANAEKRNQTLEVTNNLKFDKVIHEKKKQRQLLNPN